MDSELLSYPHIHRARHYTLSIRFVKSPLSFDKEDWERVEEEEFVMGWVARKVFQLPYPRQSGSNSLKSNMGLLLTILPSTPAHSQTLNPGILTLIFTERKKKEQ